MKVLVKGSGVFGPCGESEWYFNRSRENKSSLGMVEADFSDRDKKLSRVGRVLSAFC